MKLDLLYLYSKVTQTVPCLSQEYMQTCMQSMQSTLLLGVQA